MQRYFSEKKQNDYLFLNDDDLYHIRKVMRMKDNDKIEIVYNEKLFLAQIQNLCDDIKFKIIDEMDSDISKIPFVTLIIPFLKESKVDLILQKASEMGVSQFILCPMERCMVKIDNSKIDSKLNRWIRICKEASEQSKRNNIPNIRIINDIKCLENLEGHNFTCSTQEKSNNIKKVLKNVKNCDRINLVIGPEGGLSLDEENFLKSINFISISLGDLIMRVESVPLYLMSVINYEFME